MESVRIVKPFVLIITGPCAVGKTSIAKLVAAKYSAEYVSADEIKKKFFPNIPRITDYPDKLEILKIQLLETVKTIFNQGKSVVVDYVIVGSNQIEKYRAVFGDQLIVRVLFRL